MVTLEFKKDSPVPGCPKSFDGFRGFKVECHTNSTAVMFSWVQNFTAIWCYTAGSLPSYFRESYNVDPHSFHYLFHSFHLYFLHHCLRIPCFYFQLRVVADSRLMTIGWHLSHTIFPYRSRSFQLSSKPISRFCLTSFFCHAFLCKGIPTEGLNYFLQGQCPLRAVCLSHYTNTSKIWPVLKLFVGPSITCLPWLHVYWSGGGGGGLSGYTTLPKGLPHARGGTEATYCSCWWNYFTPLSVYSCT